MCCAVRGATGQILVHDHRAMGEYAMPGLDLSRTKEVGCHFHEQDCTLRGRADQNFTQVNEWSYRLR